MLAGVPFYFCRSSPGTLPMSFARARIALMALVLSGEGGCGDTGYPPGQSVLLQGASIP